MRVVLFLLMTFVVFFSTFASQEAYAEGPVQEFTTTDTHPIGRSFLQITVGGVMFMVGGGLVVVAAFACHEHASGCDTLTVPGYLGAGLALTTPLAMTGIGNALGGNSNYWAPALGFLAGASLTTAAFYTGSGAITGISLVLPVAGTMVGYSLANHPETVALSPSMDPMGRVGLQLSFSF